MGTCKTPGYFERFLPTRSVDLSLARPFKAGNVSDDLFASRSDDRKEIRFIRREATTPCQARDPGVETPG
ncbi:MAG TPA: hypothetical protein VGC61_03965 [Pyrinomonadaceae bacterium]